MVLFSFCHLGFKTEAELEALTLREFELHKKAQALNENDRLFEIHATAWLSKVAEATETKGGKRIPKYPTLESFYDREKRRRLILGQPNEKDIQDMKEKNEEAAIKKAIARVNSMRG